MKCFIFIHKKSFIIVYKSYICKNSPYWQHMIIYSFQYLKKHMQRFFKREDKRDVRFGIKPSSQRDLFILLAAQLSTPGTLHFKFKQFNALEIRQR